MSGVSYKNTEGNKLSGVLGINFAGFDEVVEIIMRYGKNVPFWY